MLNGKLLNNSHTPKNNVPVPKNELEHCLINVYCDDDIKSISNSLYIIVYTFIKMCGHAPSSIMVHPSLRHKLLIEDNAHFIERSIQIYKLDSNLIVNDNLSMSQFNCMFLYNNIMAACVNVRK
jgi:hypothetical protein